MVMRHEYTYGVGQRNNDDKIKMSKTRRYIQCSVCCTQKITKRDIKQSSWTRESSAHTCLYSIHCNSIMKNNFVDLTFFFSCMLSSKERLSHWWAFYGWLKSSPQNSINENQYEDEEKKKVATKCSVLWF